MYKSDMLGFWDCSLVQKGYLVSPIIGNLALVLPWNRDTPQVRCVACPNQDGVIPQMGQGEPFRRERRSASKVCERSDAHEVVNQVRISKDKRHNRDRTDGEHASPNGIQCGTVCRGQDGEGRGAWWRKLDVR